MARNLAPAFFASLQQEVTTTCHCWQITRRDGGVIGFTDLERPLVIDGVTYQSNAGFTRTNLSTSKELQTENLRLESFFSGSGITEADILRGEYDYSEVRVFLVNYLALPANLDDSGQLGFIPLLAGQLGEISMDGRTYQAEGRGQGDRYNQQIGWVVQKECRYKFGDSFCTVNLAPYTHACTVTQVVSRTKIRISGAPATAGYLNRGELQFTSGANEGASFDVLGHLENGDVELWQPPPFSFAVGDTLDAIAGCARTLDACTSFNNTINYGGEHGEGNYIPGNDALTTGRL